MGYINIMFFLLLLRKLQFNFKIRFLKKNYIKSYFIKSNIRYKISKHVVNRLANKFQFVVYINDEFNYSNLTNFVHFFRLLSSPLMNARSVSLSRTIYKNNFFLY
jgi:hypothetical protein